MRKLVLHMMTTLDGFIADTDGRLNTNWTNWDDEMKAFVNGLFAGTDTIVYGRRIYQEMVPAWTAVAKGEIQGEDLTFGKRLVELRKFVISRTITEAADGTVISEQDIVPAITALKGEDGSDILLYCGPKLLATLTALGLVDEYLVYINPIAIGRSLNLYQDLESAQTLRLIDHKVFQSGVIMHRYQQNAAR